MHQEIKPSLCCLWQLLCSGGHRMPEQCAERTQPPALSEDPRGDSRCFTWPNSKGWLQQVPWQGVSVILRGRVTEDERQAITLPQHSPQRQAPQYLTHHLSRSRECQSTMFPQESATKSQKHHTESPSDDTSARYNQNSGRAFKNQSKRDPCLQFPSRQVKVPAFASRARGSCASPACLPALPHYPAWLLPVISPSHQPPSPTTKVFLNWCLQPGPAWLRRSSPHTSHPGPSSTIRSPHKPALPWCPQKQL